MAADVVAQEQFASRYNISYITMENGLKHNFIDDIFKDSRGFLWISTGGSGLSRYDGYEFTVFNISSPKYKLKSNFIRQVCEDSFGRLWIVSDGGIDIINLDMMTKTVPAGCEDAFAKLLDAPAINVMKDSRDNIWLFGDNSLNKISFDPDGHIASIHHLPGINLTASSIAMNDIDEDGNIWAGVENRVWKLYADGNDNLKSTLVSPSLEFNPGTAISSFIKKENEVWIGTNWGLVRYNRNEEAIKVYGYDRLNNRSLSQNYITDFAITSEKQLLVSTLKGINIYDPINDNFEHLGYNEGMKSLNSDFVNCLFVDNETIWIGTESGGLNKLTPLKLSVKTYSHRDGVQGSLSRDIVNAVYEDSEGTLWVGTVEGGLNCRKADSDRFVNYTTDAPAHLSHNTVSAITVDGDNNLWVATWGNGLNVMDRNSLKVKKYIAPRTAHGFPISYVGSLIYDPVNKLMWIGANSGIYFYDCQSEQLFPLFPAGINENIHGMVGAAIDRQNNLWMGSMEGLYIIDLNSRKDSLFQCTHLKYKLDEPESKHTDRISSFCLANDGTLWIGSNSSGIYRFTPGTGDSKGTFQCYSADNGLINNNVLGILEDKNGKLWISTNNGISCFDVEKELFTNYTKDDGLPGNQFYWNAYCRLSNGLLCFGGLDGLAVIDPNRITPVKPHSDVTFTRLSVMNVEVNPSGDGKKYIDRDITVAKQITLHERDKAFSLEFSSLSYDNSATSAYFFRLLGFDEQWIETPVTRRFASYTNLPAGDYVFQVKYSSSGMFDDGSINELKITVKPFFYKTPWFIILASLMAVLMIFVTYMRRVRTFKRQREYLNRKVEERTRELKEQNEKITKQKTQIINMAKKVKELNMDKIAFFTSITHELRTPVTLIIGPIERALKQSVNPKVIEQLRLVERNSKYLLSLVNQLMDFRKVESGNMEIIATNGNFDDFLSSILAPFESFAAERDISIRKYIRMPQPFFLFDSDAMSKVLTNILSNAIKFTPNRGTVSIYAATLKDSDGKEKLFLSVRDTGVGIPEADMQKIFNRFYQSVNKVRYPVYGQSGTGIGLYLCKQIVQRCSGEIRAANNRNGKGSNFRILLPLRRGDMFDSISSISDKNSVNIPEITPAGNPPHFVPGRKTILIVEDNADMREYIRTVLSDFYNTVEAANGQEALVKLSECNVDFILSDLMMPVMDGLELSRQVKDNFSISHIPFLMLTAKTSPKTRAESYRMGADAYMVKPFSEEVLLSRIANIFDRQQRIRQQFAQNMNIDALQIEEESNDRKFLNRALEVMKENYSNPYFETVDFTAAMGVSKSLLNKKLQSITGQSTGQFMRNYRLNIARELLNRNRETRNLNISEIAYETGFNDPKYFTRCFTRRFNMPPSRVISD